MPAAVGVDIGCGMIAVKTQFNKLDVENKKTKHPDGLTPLRHSIERSIPLSAGGYNREYTATARRRLVKLEQMRRYLDADALEWIDDISPNWRLQLGSLGSGNHFIEVSLDENDQVWLFLHSGSRGVGNKIALFHIKQAQEYCKRTKVALSHPDLAYLAENTHELDDYVADLDWAQTFARYNREEMMDRLIKDFSQWIGHRVNELERINCHHNFIQHENHRGEDLWLSRKGAIQADKGRPGLIPGSMGTASYVVEGKGCAAAFNSAPHGAGRLYGRNVAKQKFTLDDLDRAMVGIEYNRSSEFLDEVPAAYKDIDRVMNDAAELVEIKHTLRQIVNVKGT